MKILKIMMAVIALVLSAPALRSSQRPRRTIVRKDFFKDIVGLDEETFRDLYGFRKAPDGNFGVLSRLNWDQKSGWAKLNWNQRFGWTDMKPGTRVGPKGIKMGLHRRKAIFQGTFSAPTVATLKKKGFTAGRGSFKILLHDPNNPQKTDIRALQADPINNGAAFQLASTFFGPLEGGMYGWESSITNMTRSPVQGEEASISAAPATIYRKYFMPLDPQHRKFRENKFYLLYALQDKLPMRITPDRYTKKGKRIAGKPYVDARRYKLSLDDTDKVAVGIHHDILVTSGYGDGRGPNDKQVRLSTMYNPQRITQILTSAYDTRFARGQWGSQAIQSVASMLLNGAYEGTILAAAAIEKVKKLYLTLVGGGSFRNDIEWIRDAILAMRDIIKQSGMEVVLIYRPDKPRKGPVRTAARDVDFLEKMCEMAVYINKRGNCKGIKGELQKYVEPFYAGGQPTSAQVAKLQSLLDRTLVQPSLPPTVVPTVAAVQFRRAPRAPEPPVQPEPKRTVALSYQQPKPRHQPKISAPEQKPIVVELSPKPSASPAPQPPVIRDTGFVQWIQDSWAYKALSNLFRGMYDSIMSWF